MPLKPKTDALAVLARVLKEGPDALLTRGEAAALIASRVKDERDTERTARNRVGTQLDRARERGEAAHHGGLARMTDGRYSVDEIAHWANLTYPGVFKDLPCRPREIVAICNERFVAGDSMQFEVTPGDLDGRLVLIQRLREQVTQLQTDRQSSELERKREVRSRLDHHKKK